MVFGRHDRGELLYPVVGFSLNSTQNVEKNIFLFRKDAKTPRKTIRYL